MMMMEEYPLCISIPEMYFSLVSEHSSWKAIKESPRGLWIQSLHCIIYYERTVCVTAHCGCVQSCIQCSTVRCSQAGQVMCRRMVCDCDNPNADLFCCPECDPRLSSQCLHQNGLLTYGSGDTWVENCQQCQCLVSGGLAVRLDDWNSHQPSRLAVKIFWTLIVAHR